MDLRSRDGVTQCRPHEGATGTQSKRGKIGDAGLILQPVCSSRRIWISALIKSSVVSEVWVVSAAGFEPATHALKAYVPEVIT